MNNTLSVAAAIGVSAAAYSVMVMKLVGKDWKLVGGAASIGCVTVAKYMLTGKETVGRAGLCF